MRDPFLREHRFAPYNFLLAGRIYPISIRDQMIRAEMFVQRALRERLISSRRKHPFIVIGAGAAGATAAALAASNGVSTVLIEGGKSTFNMQATCRTRWVCPTAYDFPFDHYRDGSFPVSGRPHHVSWNANWANLLSVRWRAQLRAMINSGNYPLKLLKYSEAKIVNSRPLEVEIRTQEPNKPLFVRDEPAQLVLTTTGFGNERRFLNRHHPYYGFRFWNTDPLQDPNVGIKRGRPEVLISGSGDGGLQDLLRIATGRSFAEVVKALGGVLDQARSAVMDAETAVGRSLHWNFDTSHDHRLLHALHRQYLRIVVRLFKDQANVDAVTDVLSKPSPTIKLLAECDHFSICYPLNHLLALLVTKALEYQTGEQVIHYNERITDIVSADVHTCNQDPWACHGHRHEVTTATTGPCDTKQTSRGGTHVCNVLVIRHGAEFKVPDRFECLIRSRQILPFDL